MTGFLILSQLLTGKVFNLLKPSVLLTVKYEQFFLTHKVGSTNKWYPQNARDRINVKLFASVLVYITRASVLELPTFQRLDHN